MNSFLKSITFSKLIAIIWNALSLQRTSSENRQPPFLQEKASRQTQMVENFFSISGNKTEPAAWISRWVFVNSRVGQSCISKQLVFSSVLIAFVFLQFDIIFRLTLKKRQVIANCTRHVTVLQKFWESYLALKNISNIAVFYRLASSGFSRKSCRGNSRKAKKGLREHAWFYAL